MIKPTTALSALALTLTSAAALSGVAHAQHEVQAYLSEGGLDFIAEQVPSYVPSTVLAPDFETKVECMVFEQRDALITMNVSNVRLEVPEEGIAVVEIDFNGGMEGELYIDDVYACAGEVTCNDSFTIHAGSARFEYELAVRDGRPVVAPRDSSITLRPEDVVFDLSECGTTGDVITAGVTFAEDWILEVLDGEIGGMADVYVAPLIEDMLDGFRTTGSLSLASYSAELTDVEMENSGVFLRMSADVSDNFAADACIAEFDDGGPEDIRGPQPELSAPGASHANLAMNLGLINQGLYTFWRRGLLCLTDNHIRALGFDLDLSIVGAMLPGFPAGTEFGFDLKLTDYPRVTPTASADGKVTLSIEGLMLDLHGDRPDGSRKTLHAEVDLNATATVGVNPGTNSIFATLDDAEITRMVMEDERDATGDGFDVARILQMLQNHILPELLHEIGPLPLTGPAFSFADYAIILRELKTNDAFLTAGVDLFRVPENDTNAPDTQIVSYPTGPVNPHTAEVRVLGSDAELPSELLQYVVTVNGEELEPSYMQSFHVGEMGESGSYQVTVAAMDMSGNIDATPETIELNIDGIVPHVAISGARTRKANQGPVDISWAISDDISAASAMDVRVETYVLDDPADALSARLIDTQELGKGATNTIVELEQVGGVYRVEVHAVDEAGNDSKSSLLLTIPSSGGCSVGGNGGPAGASFLLLALGALAMRRRRN